MLAEHELERVATHRTSLKDRKAYGLFTQAEPVAKHDRLEIVGRWYHSNNPLNMHNAIPSGELVKWQTKGEPSQW